MQTLQNHPNQWCCYAFVVGTGVNHTTPFTHLPNHSTKLYFHDLTESSPNQLIEPTLDQNQAAKASSSPSTQTVSDTPSAELSTPSPQSSSNTQSTAPSTALSSQSAEITTEYKASSCCVNPTNSCLDLKFNFQSLSCCPQCLS